MASRPRRIPIVVRPGKDDDRDEGSIAHESSIWISKLSISGFARSGAHALDRFVGAVLVLGLELEVDDATDARGRHVEPELPERLLHCAARRIEMSRPVG